MSSINPQTVPKDPRILSGLIARPGHTLLHLDFASVEPTVLATFSKDPKYLELYASGKTHDIYLYVAAHADPQADEIRKVYDLVNPTPEGIAQAKKQFTDIRNRWKTGHLSGQYGAGPYRWYQVFIADGVDCTIEDVKKWHADYWEMFAGVKAFEARLLQEREDRGGWILNGRGRPMCITDHKVRDILNTYCQSTGHDLLLSFIWHIRRLRDERQVEMHPWILNIHDATIWEVPDQEVPAAKLVMEDALKALNEELNSDIPIKGEVDVGRCFADFKD